VLVEVGSYCGRSTVVLAATGLDVVAVDPLEPGTAPSGAWEVTAGHVADFEGLVRRTPNVTWVRAPATACPRPAKPVGLLAIDGDHNYPHPLDDYRHFEPWLAPGALVAFHDYRVCAGVTRTVSELLDDKRIEEVRRHERLFVARKP